jgi:DNA polymerase (family 10)
MSIHNTEIADIFEHYATMLEITDANPFRVRAYRNASRVINALPRSAESLLAEGNDLTELPGIGDDLATKIKEIIVTGSFAGYAALQKRLPKGLIELETVPGLGPRRIKQLYEQLGIKDLSSLIKACQSGKVAELHGFGKTSVAKILAACKLFQPGEKRHKLALVQPIASSLMDYLKRAPGVVKIAIAGSFRRCKETVGDLDIVLACKNGAKVMDHFAACEDIVEILSKGGTRASVRLRTGLQVDLRVVPEQSYGAALLYFTGTKAHNIALRTIAVKRGLKINEYGVFEGANNICGKTEEDIYRLLGLPYIEPELRENLGEIEAAYKHKLPALITLQDIRGDLHAHTDATDGASSLEDMARAAIARGYEYLAITDHTKQVGIVHGQDATRVLKQLEAIDLLNARLQGFKLLKSAEVDILEDGSLDLPDEVLKQLDVTVCAVHSKFTLTAQKQTERIIRAMDNDYFNIFAHPTGRLIGGRQGYAIDMERVMRAALERGCFLELNASPDRLDLNDIHCRMAREMGLKLAISSDAHHDTHLSYMAFGLNQARRGWLEADDVINTRSLADLKKLLKRH